jgi:L-iditol 2-dehydrogenase
MPARILYKLPDSLPFERAALIEAVSIAVHAVGRHVPKPDDTVVVVGSGMIGVLVIQVLKDKGCRRIVAVDVDDDKLAAGAADGGGAHAECESDGRPAAVRDLIRSRRRRLVRGRRPHGHGADGHSERPQGCSCARQAIAEGRAAAAGSGEPRNLDPWFVCIETARFRSASICSRAARSTSIARQPQGAAEDAPGLFERLYGGDKTLMKVIIEP